jgi:hypothetical protein
MHFINAKIGGFALNFEETIDNTDEWRNGGGIAYYHVTGETGNIPTGYYPDFTMLWEVGDSYTDSPQMTHCEFDGTTCYQARAVPAIYSVSSD